MQARKLFHACLVFLLFAGGVLAPFHPQTAAAAPHDYVFRRSWGGEGNLIVGPANIAVDQNGLMYVLSSESYSNMDRVTVFSADHTTQRVWGGNGSAPGRMSDPNDIVVTPDGKVYIADSNNYRVEVFTWDGTLLDAWSTDYDGSGVSPYGIALSPDGLYLYLTRGYANFVYKFTTGGVFLGSFGGTGSGNGQFNGAHRAAVDSQGYVYVTDIYNRRVQKLKADGTYLAQWGSQGSGPGQFEQPSDISIDAHDNVYVVDGCRVQKFNTQGVLLKEYKCDAENGLGSIFSVAADAAGNLLIADANKNQVVRLSASGAYRNRWGDTSRTNWEYYSLTMDPGTQRIYGIQWADHVIGVFSPTGQILERFAADFSAHDLAVDADGSLWITDQSNECVRHYDTAWNLLFQFGVPGEGDGQFTGVGHIALDKDGSLWVTDMQRAQKFSRSGIFQAKIALPETGDMAVDAGGNLFVLIEDFGRVRRYPRENIQTYKEWGTEGSGAEQMQYPAGIALDGQGNVYIADTWNARIQVLDNNLNHLMQIGNDGFGVGQFVRPWSLAVDDHGSLYVADTGNQRIQVFSLAYPVADPVWGRVLNGGFDESFTEWTTGGSLETHYLTSPTRLMQLGMPVAQQAQGEGEGWISQTFHIDANIPHPTLSFWYQIFTNDILDYSDFFVEIQDGVGMNHLATVLRDGFNPPTPVTPSPGKNLGWRIAQYDLSAYAGQHVRLVFHARNLHPGSLGIWVNLDNVRVVDAQDLHGGRVYLPITRR